MSAGLLLVRYFFPDLLHVKIPSAFILDVEGRAAAIQVRNHVQGLELLDLTNRMIPNPQKNRSMILNQEITAPKGGIHLFATTVPEEKFEEIEGSKNISSVIPHKVTFESREEDDKYRAFATKYFTELFICHEVSDAANVTNLDKEFFTDVTNEFMKIYRYLSLDYRPKLLDEYDEPKLVRFDVATYTEGDLQLSLEERFAIYREYHDHDIRTSFRYDHQPTSFRDPIVVTQELDNFVKSRRSMPAGQEFLDFAKHAAHHLKNYKYAVIDAFICSEVVINKYLKAEKIKRKVSKSKLKDYESEVTMSYKINVELPMLLNGITDQERQVIGNVDGVRKLRNTIVHQGVTVTKVQAEQAVEAVSSLVDIFKHRDVEL